LGKAVGSTYISYPIWHDARRSGASGAEGTIVIGDDSIENDDQVAGMLDRYGAL